MSSQKDIKAIILEATKGAKLTVPDRAELGDYAFFATDAEKTVESLQANKELAGVVEVKAVGKFVNFYLKSDVLVDSLSGIDGEYGKNKVGQGKTVIIDYSAPNIAKPFGIGHLRSTIIGQALYNLYQACGWQTIGDNHLGDWGTQFGKLLCQISDSAKASSDKQNLDLQKLEEMYVQFHKDVKEHPELEEEARKWFKKLEDGDPVAKKLWQACVDVSMAEFNRIYELLGVKIDYAYGESYYEDKMKNIVKLAKDKGLAHESEGALVIDIPGQKTPLMLLKSDGATTYATRDLATLEFRRDQWNPDLVIYEVSVEQKLHFEQVFAAARLLGLIGEKTVLYHTKHGWYLGPDGKKFSTREGKTVKLEEVLQEAIVRAKKLGCKDEATAKAVGVGAIKYYDLMRSVTTDVIFDWEKVMNLEGNSGPYLQYTYARAKSVLLKGAHPSGEMAPTTQGVCGSVNFRLSLTSAVAQVLQNGLGLLGISSPERM